VWPTGRTSPSGGERSARHETKQPRTWMNVDVSPDGHDRVRPARRHLQHADRGHGRGLDTRISGAAFDMQPRFSPDGRLGRVHQRPRRHWNVWVMRPDGTGRGRSRRRRSGSSTARPGRPTACYIYARKHFVEAAVARRGRDLAYHVSGGDRPAGDRAAGLAEGRRRARPLARRPYLYYSKDVTPGHTVRVQQGPVTPPSTRSCGATCHRRGAHVT
jgi:hypothetical protein